MTKVIGYITLPVYEYGDHEFTSFRQGMLEAGPHGVSSGGGVGSDSIYAELQEGDRRVYRAVLGRDVLRGVAEMTRHPDAERLPASEMFGKHPTDED